MNQQLTDKYSQIAHGHHGQGRRDLIVRSWPRDRYEAVLFCSGTGHQVLDIGCGNGFLLWNLRHQYGELVGVEPSDSMAREAAVTLRDQRAQIYSSDILSLPFPDNSFDLIVCTDVIEHVTDVWDAFQETRRILKPNGRMIMTTPNVAYYKRRLTLLRGRFPVTSGRDEGLIPGGGVDLFAGGHFQYFTFRSLSRNLEKYGFKVTREIGFGRLGQVQHEMRTLFSGGICVVAEKVTNG